MVLLGLKHLKIFRTNYLQPLLDAGWLEMTVPGKPRSSKQKYRLTEKGRELQEQLRQLQSLLLAPSFSVTGASGAGSSRPESRC